MLPSYDIRNHRLNMSTLKCVLERYNNFFDWTPLPSIPYKKEGVDKYRMKGVSGIYFMLSDDRHILYIGKAKCLRTRLSQHMDKSSCHNNFMRKYIGKVKSVYLMAIEESALEVVEKQLIQYVCPPMNKSNVAFKKYDEDSFIRKMRTVA